MTVFQQIGWPFGASACESRLLSWIRRRTALWPSELRVKSARKDRYGATVGIVSGIVDELVVEGKRCPFVEAVSVIRFEDFFSPIVELAVADQNTQTSGGEISARFRRETFDDTRDTDFIVGPSPRRSGQNRAEGKALTAIRPTHNFG